MKIKSIKIQNLWNLYDIQTDLNSEVNVLTGNNGAGKTTILDIISNLSRSGELPEKLRDTIERAEITYEDGTVIGFISFKDTIEKLQKKAETEDVYKGLWADLDSKLDDDDRRNLHRMKINASITYGKRDNNEISMQEFFRNAKVDIISSFDASLPATMDSKRLEKLKEEEKIESALDYKLFDLLNKYSNYNGDLANQMERKLLMPETDIKVIFESIFRDKYLFMDIIDDMFRESGKKINREVSKLEFIAEDQKTHLSVYQLSSGEKQLLFILLTVLLQHKGEYILFMDEPEISLHIDWQKKLIEKIRKLNPNCQIISSSHAPFFIIEGWQESVVQLESVKNRIPK